MADSLVTAQIAIAVLQDVLFALVVGTIVGEVALFGQDDLIIRIVRRIRAASALGLLLTNCAYLWLQTALLSGLPLADGYTAITTVVTQTNFGKAWLLQTAGLLSAIAAWRNSWGTGLGIALYALGKASAGHAGAEGMFKVQVWVQWLHLSSTTVWAGGILVGAVVVTLMYQSARADRLQMQWRFCERLSRIAIGAFAVALTLGSYRALTIIPANSGAMMGHEYGYLLSIKIAAVFTAAFLGGVNRTIYLPTLGELAQLASSVRAERTALMFNRVITLEAAVMVLVLAIAAILGHTSPVDG